MPSGPVELTIDRIAGGEVSPFLVGDLRLGDELELRGPIGGYFTWTPDGKRPLMLVAGGSGIVPLMSMLRTRAQASAQAPAHLIYSSRSACHIIFRDELARLQQRSDGLVVTHTVTREAPGSWTGERGRIGRVMLARQGFKPVDDPTIFVCGPTPFVETVTDHLLSNGHEAASIKTERFGPTGESR
jgi:ferredoxin-NADP reductase